MRYSLSEIAPDPLRVRAIKSWPQQEAGKCTARLLPGGRLVLITNRRFNPALSPIKAECVVCCLGVIRQGHWLKPAT